MSIDRYLRKNIKDSPAYDGVDPSDKLSSPIWIEKSVDDEIRRMKKDRTLITIKALFILLTAPCIKVMPADKKSKGKK